MSELIVEDLSVVYAAGAGQTRAVDAYSLQVPQGSLTVLLGESGCGKTTVLNAIAGLLQPDAGRIMLGGEVMFARGRAWGRAVAVPPNRRDIGMVFQSYALWPHLSVLENVMYPARRRGATRRDAEAAARAALDTVRCGAYAQRFPGELSGGQQQRIALARAMVSRPRLLLFDEPLSNLDAGLRRGLRDELARLHRELGFTGVYVTHDQAEALVFGTQLALMEHGRIVQAGTPQAIYERPATEFVARFFGANIVPGQVVEPGLVHSPVGVLAIDDRGARGDVRLSFMPQAASLEPADDGPLTVLSALYVGAQWEVRLGAGDAEVLAIQPATAPAIGTRVRLNVPAAAIQAFRASFPNPPPLPQGQGAHRNPPGAGEPLAQQHPAVIS
jgi:iron(III) transport system ATP-binding protein